ncbi:sensor histidine kinase [Enterococcus sp. AZ103]|uniref:sensor histidine kinase n=1 Tax=Enterococcus sp. AZ103 TaxID=2774628 RepID=UPI003F233B72
MGKRSSKILIISLLILLFSGGLLFWNYQSFQTGFRENQAYLLGKLIEESSLSEEQVIRIVNQETDEAQIETGQLLSEKYGLLNKETTQQNLIQKYTIKNLLITITTVFLLIGFFIFHLKRLRKEQILVDNQLTEQTEAITLTQLQLQKKSKEVDDIKSSITEIAHQLKTPISSLKLSMEIALSENYSVDERQDFKKQAEIQINKLDLMLDGLVKISQLEADLISLSPQQYSLEKLLEKVVNGLIMSAIEKKIEIEVIQTEAIDIFVDIKWTREALGNILENAIKYSPTDSKIRIRCSSLVKYALIEIIDQGPGIAKEELSLIYQRFYRGQQTVETEIEGSGVGLFLARKIIEEQHDALMVKNQYPQGSNFQITLPLIK